MTFVIKVVGLKRLQRKMLRRKNRLTGGNARGVSKKANMQALAVVDRWIQKNFDGQGKLSMGGGGWQPLSARTLLARQKGWGDYVKSNNPKILQNKGNLKNRWKHYASERTSYIRSTTDYGIYHHKGEGVPKRRITPTQKQIRPQLKKHYRWFIRNGIR